MRKTIKSTKPKTKRKYTRKSKLPTERTQRTEPSPLDKPDRFHDWFVDEVYGAFDNVRNDVENIKSLLKDLDVMSAEMTHRLDKTDHNVKAIFLHMKELE